MKYILFILFFLVAQKVFAQSPLHIKIMNRQNTAIQFAAVNIFKDSKSTLVQKGKANENGELTIKYMESAVYLIEVTALGYRDTTINFRGDKSDIKIILTEDVKSLNEVTISARQMLIERKIDRTVFNVEASVSSIGSNSLEVLDKVPGVRVQDEKISLAGKNSIIVLIDDKPIQITGSGLSNLLRSISAENISKIEVITNPPAKYDAEGNSGIINIVTKKNKNPGLTGSVNISDRVSGYNFLDGSANLNYSSGKLSLFTTVSSGYGALKILQDIDAYYPTQLWSQSNLRKNNLDYNNGELGVNYDVSKRTTIGFDYMYSNTRPDMTEKINNSFINSNNRPDSLILTNAATERKKIYNSLDVNFKSKLDTSGTVLYFNFDALKYTDNNSRTFTSNVFTGEQNTSESQETVTTNANQDISIYTVKADLELPFKFIQLSTGGKLTFIRNNSGTGLYHLINGNKIPDSTQTDNFTYDENIQALYINGRKTIGKWGFQLGFRGEFTETTGISAILDQTNKINYFKLFPTFYTSYKADKDNVFSVNYGKRIGRPNYEALNPFKWYTSPYSYFEGNPFLQPSISNNFEFSHTYKNFLSSSIYFNQTSNNINQIAITDQNQIIFQYQNLVNIYAYGMIESVSLHAFKWLESYNQIQPYFTMIRPNTSLAPAKQNNLSAYFSSSNTFFINRDKLTSAGINFWYQLPALVGVYKFNSYGNVSVGAKTSFLHKKMIIGISGSDIFKMQVQQSEGLVNGTREKLKNYNDSRRVSFSMSYKFGSGNKAKSSKNGNTEEKIRL